MVRKEKDDFLAAQGLSAANCLIRDLIDPSKFFSNIKIRRNAQIADLACGVGQYSIAIEKLLDKKGRVRAIDLWDEGIDMVAVSQRPS